MKIDTKNIKPKYIIIALAVIGCIYLYHSFSKEALKETAKETAVDLAKDAGRYALNKAKDKYNQMKKKEGGGAVLSEGQDPSEPSKSLDDYVNGTAVVERNEIVEVGSDKFISVDNVGVTAEQADTMLMNVIKEGDLDRVKYLVESGVKLDFTDDKLCVKNRYHDTERFYEHEMPADVMSVKKVFKYLNPIYMYTTDCDKMFLQAAYKELNRELSDEEFDFFYPNNTNEAIEVRRQEQKTRREIFDFLLSRTPKKDYYQFADAIANPDVPQDVRLKLAKLYIENIQSLPVSPSRKRFLTAYETAAVELLQESPGNLEWLEIAAQYKAPLYNFFVKTTHGTIDWLATGVYQVASVQNNYNSISGRKSAITLPELTVQATKTGQYDYTIGNMDENLARVLSPTMYTNVKEFAFKDKFVSLYLANRELQIMKLLMDSGKINVNMQNGEGKSILHYIVELAADESNGASADRAAAIMIRHLLNHGVDPTLLSKKEKATAHGLLQLKKSEYNKRHPDSHSIPFREMQNAFTLKTYN